MSERFWIPIVAGLCFGAALPTIIADPVPKVTPSPTTDPASKSSAGTASRNAGMVELALADGTTVRITMSGTNIPIHTKYGRLDIPVNEIRRIEFAFRYPDGIEEQLIRMIGELGDPNFRRRESAHRQLSDYRESAYPLLRKFAKSSDAEVAKRCGELMKAIEEKVDPNALRFPTEDVVSAGDFAAKGKIDLKAIVGKSRLFGDVNLPIAEIRSLRSVSMSGEATISLDYSKFTTGPTSTWVETEFELSGDMPIEIRVTGSIHLRPGAGYESGPKGHNGYHADGLPAGAVLARVGSGERFIVGERYVGTPRDRGRLLLAVTPSPWGNQGTGNYKVTITLNPVPR